MGNYRPYRELHDGKCKVSGKRRYPTRIAGKVDNPGRNIYWCRHCTGWHVTRNTDV